MFAGWKRQWRTFRAGRPGSRFQDRYERSQKLKHSQPWHVRFLKPALALVLIAGGVVLCFIPGPGIPLLIIGAGLFADNSLVLAQALDWMEVRLRRIVRWATGWWRRASLLAKEAVIAAATLVAAFIAYGGYRFLVSR